MDASGRRLSWKNIIFYGVGDLYGGGSFMIIGLFFLYFLTDVVGLAPAMAGLVFTLGEVWDAVTDPMMGIISDRTKSRFGRRRIYLLAGIIPVFISFAALWIPLSHSGEIATFLFYGGVYLLFNTVFTMVMVPYSALNADMTADYRQRTRLSGTRIIFSQISTLIAATIPKFIIDGAASESTGFLMMGLVFGVVYALPFLLVFFGTREELVDHESEPVSWETLKQVLRNRSFRVHIGMYIAAYTAIDILMALYLYFMKYYMEQEGLYTLGIGALIVTQISMLPFFTWLANRRGKAYAYRVGLSISIAGFLFLLFFLTPGSSLLFVVVPSLLIGAGLSAASMIPWAMLPTVIDVDELVTGSRRSGIYSGGMTLIRKIAQGVIALPLVGFTLDILGFIPNQPQEEIVRQGIRLLLIFGPTALFIAGIFVSFGFLVTPKSHAVVKREIERRRGDASLPKPTEEEELLLARICGSGYRPES